MKRTVTITISDSDFEDVTMDVDFGESFTEEDVTKSNALYLSLNILEAVKNLRGVTHFKQMELQ